MNHSTPGLPIRYHLPEFTQTHVHWVCDAIQPSHPLSSPSPPTPNPSQHQSLFQSQLFAWGGQSTGVPALASFEELTHWKRVWCWEGLGVGGEGDDRGWDSWMASRTQWTWVWVNSGWWWWTGRSGVLQFMGSERVGHNKRLNWTELREFYLFSFSKLL